MELVLKLAVMLVTGLVAKHAVTKIAERRRSGLRFRVPKLCSYATAGILAALVRYVLEWGTELDPLPIWIIFGTVWGVTVGFLLPLSKPVRQSH